jgi:CheY-like chemotaxis protein
VLIADDDDRIGTVVTRLLSPSCDVVGRVDDVAALMAASVQLRPDVILLDFSLRGDLTVLDVCRRLKTLTPAVKIVAFTAHDGDDLRELAHEAGASGYVWKLEAATELLPTIQTVVGSASGD